MALSSAAEHNPQSLQSADQFRLIMDAMARPGMIQEISSFGTSVGALNPAAAMVASTLCDHETPVWFDPSLATEDVIDFIRFQCGSPIAKRPEDAFFVFFGTCPDAETLNTLSRGTADYPDQSATAVIQTTTLSSDGPIRLSGPGIKATHAFGADDIDPAF